MSKPAYTKGPWKAHLDDDIWVAPSDDNAPVICDLIPRNADAYTLEDEANAYLIAAAPMLLEAVEYWVEFAQKDERYAGWLGKARAAIAKAKGEAK